MNETQPPMSASGVSRRVGVLVSGGLDSAILVGHLLADGYQVQPFYVESHLHWQRAERHALDRFLVAMAVPQLDPLVELELPLGDLYGHHWSVTGQAIPDERTADEAVFLPGRNALLILKPALWCQLHAIGELALATLGSNPFADSSDEFFQAIESALNLGDAASLRIVRPFGEMHKREVMLLGSKMTLGLTFSCIDPVGLDHCGQCNKCAERRAAFASVNICDPTQYANTSRLPSPGPAGPGLSNAQPSHP